MTPQLMVRLPLSLYSPSANAQQPGLTMQHSRSLMSYSQTASPSPPSSHSSPIAPPVKTAATLLPPAANPIWSSHSSPNPNGHASAESASDEGNASKFFSSRTSSIGSNHSAASGSPPRWVTQAQPQNQASTQIPNPPQFHRPGYPAPIVHDQPDVRYEYPSQSNLSAAERELHVVLPEPWMDAPYVFQLAHTQGWDIVDIRMQPSGAILVFATPGSAARAFTQVNGSVEGVTWMGTGTRVQAHWAGAVGRANEEEAQLYGSRPAGGPGGGGGNSNAGKQLEFSIFVGDLAPETTNADLVAVFRNPLLGLRSDREPRVIRPFTSCRSAKIMVSPETGISKGYGFVRFTDEADQQRALIEMQGLYCLSRPMRLSHATAKSKSSNGGTPNPNANNGGYSGLEDLDSYVLGRAGAPISGGDVYGRYGRHSMSGPDSYPSRGELGGPPRSRSVDAEELFGGLDARVLGVEGSRALSGALSPEGNRAGGPGLSEGARLESARALLGVLNSADPYNTTVFVGGLSGLIAEETLRGFFVPFGEIHYVKIPPGKGCGFVQFVRKADAERAIERMQGFPIGGGKIRLSWGRSQSDKAAQAAAQAAQLGLNLGGLHLNSLSAADSARLFQTLEALGYSSVPTGAKSSSGGNVYQGPQSGNSYQQGQQGGGGLTSPPFYEQQGAFPPNGSGFGGQQGGFPMSQPFSPTQSFGPTGSSPPGSISPQQGSFGKAQQGSFGPPAQQAQFTAQNSLYEPSSVGLSRAYTTHGTGFQPFSSEPSPFGRAGERSTAGSVPMGHSASASAHLASQPYSTRHSLAFEPEAFGLQARERQLTAPAQPGSNPTLKTLNLGLAGMNLSQRREFGLDGGPLSAPLSGGRNPHMTATNGNNNGGMKPSVSDSNVYIH